MANQPSSKKIKKIPSEHSFSVSQIDGLCCSQITFASNVGILVLLILKLQNKAIKLNHYMKHFSEKKKEHICKFNNSKVKFTPYKWKCNSTHQA